MAGTTTRPIPHLPDISRRGIRVGRTFSFLGAVTVLAVIYGELLPFRFAPDAVDGGFRGVLARLDWGPSSSEDVLVNVLIFVPVGLLSTLHFAGGAVRWTAAVLAGSLFAAMLGTALEVLQVYLPIRVASGADAVNNALGGLLGALLAPRFHLWWPRIRGRVSLFLAVFPHHVVWVTLAVGISVAALAPFDFSLLPSSLIRGLSSVRGWPVFGEAGWTFGADEMDAGGVLGSALRCAGAYAALSYVGVHALRERGDGLLVAAMATLRRSVVLAVGLECLQLLTRSHVCELLDVLAGVAGSIAGVCAASLAAGRFTGRVVPTHVGTHRMSAAVLLVAWLAAETLAAGLVVPPTAQEHAGGILWLPLVSEFYRPAHVAFAELATMLGEYAGLAGLVLVALGGGGCVRRLVTVLIVIGGAVCFDFALPALGAMVATTTGPAIAAAGATLAVSVVAWASRSADVATRELLRPSRSMSGPPGSG